MLVNVDGELVSPHVFDRKMALFVGQKVLHTFCPPQAADGGLEFLILKANITPMEKDLFVGDPDANQRLTRPLRAPWRL